MDGLQPSNNAVADSVGGGGGGNVVGGGGIEGGGRGDGGSGDGGMGASSRLPVSTSRSRAPLLKVAGASVDTQAVGCPSQCHALPHTELHGDVVKWGAKNFQPDAAACESIHMKGLHSHPFIHTPSFTPLHSHPPCPSASEPQPYRNVALPFLPSQARSPLHPTLIHGSHTLTSMMCLRWHVAFDNRSARP
jgi:hypothetical protein